MVFAAPSLKGRFGSVVLVYGFLCGTLFGVLTADFGAHVDGPGIGIEWDFRATVAGEEQHHTREKIVSGLLLVDALLSLGFFLAAPSKKVAVGVVACGALGMFAGMIAASQALPAWWRLGCERGHAYACYAAAGGGNTDAKRALARRACDAEVWSACDLLAPDPSTLPPIGKIAEEKDVTTTPQIDMEACGASVRYPTEAAERNLEHDIALRILLDDHGRVRDVKPASEEHASFWLQRAAEGALRYRCKFAPAIGLDGKPVAYVIERYVFTFAPERALPRRCAWQIEIVNNTLSYTGAKPTPELFVELDKLLDEANAARKTASTAQVEACLLEVRKEFDDVVAVWDEDRHHEETQEIERVVRLYLSKLPHASDAGVMHYELGRVIARLTKFGTKAEGQDDPKRLAEAEREFHLASVAKTEALVRVKFQGGLLPLAEAAVRAEAYTRLPDEQRQQESLP